MPQSRSHAPVPPRHLPSRVRYLGPCQASNALDVTLVLRRRQPLPRTGRPLQRASFAARYGADPEDVARLRAFAREHGMQETGCDMACRALHLHGSIAALQRAFSVQMCRYEVVPGGAQYVGCAQPPTLPDAAALAVLGLDRRPIAHPLFRIPRTTPTTTFTPLQIGALYQYPSGNGSGQTVAIIELGGGYQASDLATYFKGLGVTTPTVSAVSVDGGSNQPGSSADAEVMLDIELSGALAPGADYVVYFAPNTDQGFYNAISQAAQSKSQPATVMSISWGGPEDSWSTASRTAMESALQDAVAVGVSVCVAAGDGGSSDGESDGQPHVDYPASSPSTLGCGGTRLTASGDTIASEVVWNETAADEGATGGGVSSIFALPPWQANAKVPKSPSGFVGRGVPDVAGNADPLTGYQIFVDGQSEVVGGTSAVAPLWAALIARLNQQLGKPLGDANAALYAIGESAFNDITQGNNGAYSAGPGWDACTGLGSPKGQALLAALGKGSAASKPARGGKPRPVKAKPSRRPTAGPKRAPKKR
ncbi:MAG TPA: S53 family serine peptidase [Rhodanobacteraceae bacterium]